MNAAYDGQLSQEPLAYACEQILVAGPNAAREFEQNDLRKVELCTF